MATAAPENYSNLINVMFTDNMTGWDFVNNTKNVYTSYVPDSFFWLVILILPYIMMYNRQNGVLIVSVMYLFTGGIIATILPSFLAPYALWFVLIGAGGLIYKFFIREA